MLRTTIFNYSMHKFMEIISKNNNEFKRRRRLTLSLLFPVHYRSDQNFALNLDITAVSQFNSNPNSKFG